MAYWASALLDLGRALGGERREDRRAEAHQRLIVRLHRVEQQAARRGELEAEPVVGVDPIAGHARHVRLGEQKEPQHAPPVVEAHPLEVLAKPAHLRPSSLDRAEVERRSLRPADQQVVAGRDLPDAGGRKDAPERRHDHAHVFGREAVAVDPLHHHPARPEAFAREREELAGEERRDAADPRIGGLGGDDVVLARSGEQEIPRVGDDQPGAAIAEDVVVLAHEVARGLHHGGLDLHDIHPPDGVPGHGAGRDPAAQTDDEHVARVVMNQERQVAEHDLRRHVRRVVRGVHLAVDAEARDPVGSHHRDGRARPVPVEDHLPPFEHRRHRAVTGRWQVLDGVDRRAARHHPRVPLRQEEDTGGGGEASDGGRPSPPRDVPQRRRHQHGCEQEIGGDAGHDRGVNADRGHEQEAGQHGAADGADGVEGVEPPGFRAGPFDGARARGHRARKRRADEERRSEQRQAAHHDLHCLDERRGLRALQGQKEHLRRAFEDEHDEHPTETDAGLDGRERGRAGAACSPEVRVGGGAAGETGEEGHEHRRERVGRAADHEGERPCPRDLVDHGHGARDGQRERDEPGLRRPDGTFRRSAGACARRRRVAAADRAAASARMRSARAVPDRHQADRRRSRPPRPTARRGCRTRAGAHTRRARHPPPPRRCSRRRACRPSAEMSLSFRTRPWTRTGSVAPMSAVGTSRTAKTRTNCRKLNVP